MFERKKIILDIDGVIRDTLTSIVDIYNETFGTEYRNEDVFEYDLNKVFVSDVSMDKLFFVDNSERIFMHSKPLPKSIEACNKMMEVCDVYFVSKQTSPETMVMTLKWLKNNGITPKNVCFVSDKSVVGGADYIVDDLSDNFNCSDAKNKILVNAPYNKNVKGDFTRVDSLNEFVELFLK